MPDYILLDDGAVVRTADGAIIPPDPNNADYQDYLDWVNMGNTPGAPTPLPPRKYDTRQFVREAQTTNATPVVVTFPIAENTGYIGTVYILGIQDVSPFNRATARKAFMVARRTGNAILDGQEDLHTPFQRGASTWTVVLGVSGPNVTITLTGAAGINIDWTLWGEFFRFNKDGLID